MNELVLLLRVIASLAVVIGVGWFAARIAIRQGLATAPRDAELQVRSRLGLVKGAQIVVVRHGDADLVLGVTSDNVTLLRKIHVSGPASGAGPTTPWPSPNILHTAAPSDGAPPPGRRPRGPQLSWLKAKAPHSSHEQETPPDFLTAFKDATRKAVNLK